MGDVAATILGATCSVVANCNETHNSTYSTQRTMPDGTRYQREQQYIRIIQALLPTSAYVGLQPSISEQQTTSNTEIEEWT